MIDTWKCHICGRERPDALIGVYKRDMSLENNFPAGTITENIRYCLDTPSCSKGAKNFSFIGKSK